MTDNETPSDLPVYLQTDEVTNTFLTGIAGEKLLAVDTEAASFHRYHDRTYLLQLSTRTRTAVIDPLTVTRLEMLGELLNDPAIEIIFHDSDYDLRMLDRDYQFRVNRIFDTRLAAQLLNEPGVGLAALLEKYFGITLDKKYQRADWSRRPLIPEMLSYAAMDTKYLPQLRDILRDKLAVMGRLSWAEEEFALLTDIRWSPGSDEGFWKLKGSKLLRGQAVAVLRELYQWRDQVAKHLDRAPFRVLNNETLFDLARLQPRDLMALSTVRGLSPETVHRRGPELIEAINRGMAVPENQIPKPERGTRTRPDPAMVERLDRLKIARNTAALRLDLAPGVLCPNGTLEAVARAQPGTLADLEKIPELRRWQRAVIGEELLVAASDPAKG
ncbi:MAG: ribonuclease D [Gemmatimonadota bacterium]